MLSDIYYTGNNDGSALIFLFVECMERRFRIDFTQSACTLLCLYWCAFKFEVFDTDEFAISLSCAVQIHNDGDADSICVNLMERCRVGDARTGRTCAGLVVCLNLKVL